EATQGPQLLVVRLPLFRRDRERRFWIHVVLKAAEGLGALAEDFRIRLLQPLIRRCIQLLLVHRQAEIRRSLKNRQMRRFACGFLSYLNATRARTDDAHPLAVKVHALLRPQRRMVTNPAERIDPLDRREIWLGGEADAEQEEAGPQLDALGFAL